MDIQTADYYSSHAGTLVGKYDTLQSEGISRYFGQAFPEPGARILDVGCGTGRDMRILRQMGYRADGVDPCGEFVAMLAGNGYSSSVRQDALPGLETVDDAAYDGLLCSAVLQHIPGEQLFDAAFTLRRILRENGRLLLSIPLSDPPIDPDTRRDPDGRLFNMIVPEELQLLFERIGFKMPAFSAGPSLPRRYQTSPLNPVQSSTACLPCQSKSAS